MALLKKRPPHPEPHQVNHWYSEDMQTLITCWYNGKDGYNLYKNGELIETVYFSSEESHRSAVQHACSMGFLEAKGKTWEQREKELSA